jgi:hypothetical protein
MRLDCHLGSHPNCDEFQVDSIVVFVSYDAVRTRREQLVDAERRLATLEQDSPKVQALVAAHVGSAIQATVVGIRIQPDQSSSYDCTFFDGEYEDQFFYVFRAPLGELRIEGL